MERIGVWSTGIHGDYEVGLDGKVLRVVPTVGGWGKRIEFKREFGRRYFGDSEFLVGVDGDYVTRILWECDGKTEDEICKIADAYKGRRAEWRAIEAKKRDEWNALRERFGGIVIGLDKDVDVYSSGFSVRVLFASRLSFGDRAEFLKRNRNDFLRWVIGEISDSKKILRRIGDIGFYSPVEIINLRVSECEVKFEVKGVA